MAFYVTMCNERQIGRIAGPFSTKEAAEAMVKPAWALANKINPFTHFCSFGVGRYEDDTFYGPLNKALGMEI